MATKKEKYYDRFGIEFPEYVSEERAPALCKEDILAAYPDPNDVKGNPPRKVECFGRYRITGEWEYVHPLGVPDCVVKGGVTVEFKTGHGWFIEPCFNSLQELEDYLDERRNPMLNASHVAYLPYRAQAGEDCNDCTFLTAVQFRNILGKYHKLQAKENRGKWGIAIKPWIRDGYSYGAKSSGPSAKVEEALREELVSAGLCIEEFADKMGIELHDL